MSAITDELHTLVTALENEGHALAAKGRAILNAIEGDATQLEADAKADLAQVEADAAPVVTEAEQDATDLANEAKADVTGLGNTGA